MSLAARCARITHKALTSVCSHNLPLREHTASPLSVRQNQNEILSGRRAPREQWTVDGGPSLMRFRIRRVLPSIRPATRSPEVCWQLWSLRRPSRKPRARPRSAGGLVAPPAITQATRSPQVCRRLGRSAGHHAGHALAPGLLAALSARNPSRRPRARPRSAGSSGRSQSITQATRSPQVCWQRSPLRRPSRSPRARPSSAAPSKVSSGRDVSACSRRSARSARRGR